MTKIWKIIGRSHQSPWYQKNVICKKTIMGLWGYKKWYKWYKKCDIPHGHSQSHDFWTTLIIKIPFWMAMWCITSSDTNRCQRHIIHITTDMDPYGVFLKWGIHPPIAGFVVENPPKSGWFGDTTVLGHLQINEIQPFWGDTLLSDTASCLQSVSSEGLRGWLCLPKRNV